MLDKIVLKAAIRFAAALAISVFVYQYFSLTRGFWVPMTVALVLQPTLGSTLRRGFQRFIGTLLGIYIGSSILYWVHTPWLLDSFIVLTLFVAFYLEAFNLINYGIFVVPLTAMVIILISTLMPQNTDDLIWARCFDTSIGAFIAIICSYLFVPFFHNSLVKEGIKKTKISIEIYSNILRSPNSNETEKNNIRQELEGILYNNRLNYDNGIYEYLFNTPKIQTFLDFILESEKLLQLLLGWDELQSEPGKTQEDLIILYQNKITVELKKFHESFENSLEIFC